MLRFTPLIALVAACAVQTTQDDGLIAPGADGYASFDDGVDDVDEVVDNNDDADTPDALIDDEEEPAPIDGVATGDFVNIGSSWANANGVAVHGTRRSGVIGAFSNTCEVDADGGMMGSEFNPGPGTEEIEDGDDGGGSIGLRVLTSSPNTLAVTTWFDGAPIVDASTASSGVEAARFTPDGVVAIANTAAGCEVQFLTDALVEDGDLLIAGDCQDLAVRSDGTVIVAADNAAVLVAGSTVREIGIAAQVEAVGDWFALSEPGGNMVRVVDHTGYVQWRVAVEDGVVDMESSDGMLVIATPSELLAFDEQGRALAAAPHSDGVDQIDVSGDLVGVVTAYGTDFYELRE